MKKKKTKWILRVVLLVSTVTSLFFVPWALVMAWLAPLPGTVQEQVDEAPGHGFEGIIVYVDKSGEPPAFFAAGWHDRQKKIPANPRALFKIASISKLYDAVAVTKLVHAKRLSLDGTLADYLPKLAGRIEYAETIWRFLPTKSQSGPVCPIRAPSLTIQFKKAGGYGEDLKWPADGIRHTFVTYHVAMYSNTGLTSLLAGWEGQVTLLHNNYRGLATLAQARKFWAIRPRAG